MLLPAVTVTQTPLSGVLVIEPRIFGDARGFFCETYHADRYAEAGIETRFVQDNVSRSGRGTLRGLHFQAPPHAQAKLVSCTDGSVFDVAVDLRAGSATYGEWFGAELSAANMHQLLIPEGFAHGFVVTSETALFSYKVSSFYAPHAEGSIAWNDASLAIDWPVAEPILSDKDLAAPAFAALAPMFAFDERPI